MTNTRNKLFNSYPSLQKLVSNVEADEVSEEAKKLIILEHEKSKCKELYQVKKIHQHLKPFLDICKFKDEDEARNKLFKQEEKNQSTISDKTTTLPENDYLTTIGSYFGLSSNEAKAEQIIKIILTMNDLCKNKKNNDKEPIFVIHTLQMFCKIYTDLPKRSPYSIANFFSKINLTSKEPRTASAIKTIFKEFDLDPDNPSSVDKVIQHVKDLFQSNKIDTPSLKA